MGIGTTVKNMLGSENTDESHPNEGSNFARDGTYDDDARLTNDPSRLTNSNRATHQLPAGTGPGTSGKPRSGSLNQGSLRGAKIGDEAAIQRDFANTRGDVSGYGTDASAAVGGSLEGSHQAPSASQATGSNIPTGSNLPTGSRLASGSNTGGGAGKVYDRTADLGTQHIREVGTSASAAGSTAADSSQRASQIAREEVSRAKGNTITSGREPVTNLSNISESSEIGRQGDTDVRLVHEREVQHREYDIPQTREGGFSSGTVGGLSSGIITAEHNFGHPNKNGSKDSMPSANAEEDTNQLQPVTHELIRHLETEEVARVREVDRHIHHIQYHTQPVIASEELVEQIRENMVPVTTVREIHTNRPEDTTLFEGQVRQYHDTLSHAAKERTVVDRGVTVKERVHHHVHHVIQPIIEKETIDKQRIRTTIPIHEIMHEAPVVHQSQTHSPVPLEHFLTRGGSLSGAISQDQISSKVLRVGQCAREVDGVAESLERQLNLKKSDSYTTTGVSKGPGATKKVVETDEQFRTTVAPIQN